MKTNAQKSNWVLDALLFTGFIILFVLDLTGLAIHQWLGLFGGLLAAYHLIRHWDWVTAVTTRFFGKTSGQARAYYLLDATLLLGFFLIIATGLIISTWFNLALTNYTAWAAFHKLASYVTLALVVLKIGLHWRWIVRVARQSVFAPAPQPVPVTKSASALKPAPVTVSPVTRRDFLKLMGIVSAASVLAFSTALKGDDDTQSTTAAAASQSVTVAQSSGTTTTTTSSACTGSCPKNKHCSYPGNCRRYQDTNGNGRCDLGECA